MAVHPRSDDALQIFAISQNDDLVKVQLLDTNRQYAHIRYRDGRESNVSLNDLFIVV